MVLARLYVGFIARGGDAGPCRAHCRAALQRHIPELICTYDRLVAISGGSDRAARFPFTWCSPHYLVGCSLAAAADRDDVRLVRNYDPSPDLNEGLLLRTDWTGRAVMGMVEFLGVCRTESTTRVSASPRLMVAGPRRQRVLASPRSCGMCSRPATASTPPSPYFSACHRTWRITWCLRMRGGRPQAWNWPPALGRRSCLARLRPITRIWEERLIGPALPEPSNGLRI